TSVQPGVVVLTKPSESFTFTGAAEPPTLSLNRGFSTPIKVVANQSTDDLRFLAVHDSDSFNRWQAVQTLATNLLIANVAAVRAARERRRDDGLIAALAAILSDSALEPAFIAQALTMPGEADIARELGGDVDPDAILAARRDLRRMISHLLGGALHEAYGRL